MTVLWHDEQPIGICVFTTPPRSLRGRNRFFGLSGRWQGPRLKILNRQVLLLSRVVLHPSYRGAGIAAAFVRASCESTSFPWIETLAQLGSHHPLFLRAGFVNVECERAATRPRRSRKSHSSLYGVGRCQHGRVQFVSSETHEKSRYAAPAYFIFDNRAAAARAAAARGGGNDGADGDA